jgi:cell division protein FtsZ
MGYAVMGTATAKGSRRTVEAAQRAIASPLLEAGAIDGARGILINITGSSTLKLAEVNEASTIIQSAAHEDANIIFGAVLDEKMNDEVKITVIATGFKADQIRRRERASAAAAAPQPQFGQAPPPIHYEPAATPAAAAPEAPAPFADSTPPAVNTGAMGIPAEPPAESPGELAPPEPVTRTWQAPTPVRENASLESVARGLTSEFEQDDLDVPAFLRKRNENH